jgi:hypothetical protein
MKGFGFPGAPSSGSGSSGSTPSYRADTSKQKSELINVLKRSEQLWNDEKNEESTFLFRQVSFSYVRPSPCWTSSFRIKPLNQSRLHTPTRSRS